MIRPAVLLLALLAAPAAYAGAALDLLFATPHLTTLETGETVRYVHERRSAPALGLGADLTETVTLRRTGASASEVTLDADGAARALPFDGLSGNPVLMVFLERVTRAVGEATGGSPFYLRNRMKDAMRGGLALENGVVAFRPFAEDPNRTRLGAFADLEIRIAVDEAAPGMLRALRAETPDAAFVEEFVIDDDV
jgi:hypothetical protein